MSGFCYFNGKILSFEKAAISLNDLGVIRGYGIFEALKTVNNKIFLYDEHFARFKKSADNLHIKIPVSKAEIKEIIFKLIKKNKIKKASVKIVLTGGKSEDGLRFDSKTPTFYILVSELKSLKEEFYKNGVKLSMVDNVREPFEIKTTNYLKAVKKIHESEKKENFFEILYKNNDNILECSTSNFFVFLGDKLITPQNGVLKGTTRNLVLNIAKKIFETEERDLALNELSVVSEAFLTATNKNIIPVVKIDNITLGNGKPGENTKKLMEMLKEFMEKY